jgi:hypothetical protein
MQRMRNATCRNRGAHHMRRHQPIITTSLRGTEGMASTGEERKQLGLVVGHLTDAVEEDEERLERVLGHLQEISTELERYVYLIRLCDRNERLFYKVLISDRIRFLLASDRRKSLLEIWSNFPSFARHAHFDRSQATSRAAAA